MQSIEIDNNVNISTYSNNTECLNKCAEPCVKNCKETWEKCLKEPWGRHFNNNYCSSEYKKCMNACSDKCVSECKEAEGYSYSETNIL